jgi:ACS family D-galactonate transporter-like MFS transporter
MFSSFTGRVMPETPPAHAEPIARPRNPSPWPMVSLLVVSVAINYIDRSNLSIAMPLIRTEMNLTPPQMGLLLSSFFWSYATFQIVAGWLVDRWNVNVILCVGFMIWSGATAATGLVATFATLLACRLLLGIGESVAYPAYAKIFTKWLEERNRGIANALIDAGSKFGPAVGTAVGGLIVAHFGWRSLFVAIGLGGLLWIPAWINWRPRGAASGEVTIRQAPPKFSEILRHPAVFATFTGHFAGNYFYYFLLTWLPSYLVQERHFSLSKMAVVGALPPLVSAGATLCAGYLSYRALCAGSTPTKVRRTCTTVGLTFATIIVLVPLTANNVVAMVLLMLASVSYGIFASSHWAITQTIAGPLAVGRWSGLQNFVGNLAGVVAPTLTGYVVGWTGNFFWAFVATGVVALIGAAGYWFGLGAVEPAVWSNSTPSSTEGVGLGG